MFRNESSTRLTERIIVLQARVWWGKMKFLYLFSGLGRNNQLINKVKKHQALIRPEGGKDRSKVVPQERRNRRQITTSPKI